MREKNSSGKAGIGSLFGAGKAGTGTLFKLPKSEPVPVFPSEPVSVFPFLALLVLAMLSGCWSSQPAPQPAPAEAAPQPSKAIAHIMAVDLEGHPVSGVAPIATTQPNAFDEPVAHGPLTKEDGTSDMTLPGDQRLYVRAWDPDLKKFANNYYEVQPTPGAETEVMRITMVPGASLDAVVLAKDGTPIPDTNIGIMMFHPAKGAWWPAQADTDARGAVHFPALPAGIYTLKIKAATGAETEVKEVKLPPDGKADLGSVTLQ